MVFYPALSSATGVFDELDTTLDTGYWENLDHGYASVAVFYYDCRPSLPSISYIGCGDTGVARSTGSLGWRDVGGLDAYGVGCVQAADGMRYWGNLGDPYFVHIVRDIRPRASGAYCLLPGGLPLTSRANHAVTPDGNCVVSATASDGRLIVVRIDSGGVAAQISQNFAPQEPWWVAVHPTDRNLHAVITLERLTMPRTTRGHVWITNSGASADATTRWSEAGGDPSPRQISTIAYDAAGTLYVLLTEPLASDGAALPTPLYRIRADAWEALTGTGAPRGGLFGHVVADPVDTDVVYVSHGASVYQVARDMASAHWRWTPMSDGLPGAPVHFLWTGNIAAPEAPPRVLLRAAMPTRGVFERDVTVGAPAATGEKLYMRDNILDLGLLPRSPSGPDPFDPANPAANLYHYMCADIKVDAQRTAGATRAYFQTDPVVAADGYSLDDPDTAMGPMTHVLFEMLRDNSQELITGSTARVHVQVLNRSNDPAGAVSVWAIACPVAAGVPSLDDGRTAGDSFWSQFRADGTIVPALPPSGRWMSVGEPIVVRGATAARPRVATFLWTVPATARRTAHYCIVAFLHSMASPVTATISPEETSVDTLTPAQRQIGQKNLQILNPSAPPDMSGGMMMSAADVAPGGTSSFRLNVEFHNPDASPRESTIVLDVSRLSVAASVHIGLTPLHTRQPLSLSIQGARLREARRGCFGWLKRAPASPVTLEAKGGAPIIVEGVQLPPRGWCGAELVVEGIENGRTEDVLIHAQQLVKQKVVGGAVFVLPADAPKHVPATVPPYRWEENEREQEDEDETSRLPPWIRAHVEEARRVLRKKVRDPS